MHQEAALKIELALSSRLIREALGSLLTAAGFSLQREDGGQDNDRIAVIIDLDDCKDQGVIDAYKLNGDSIILLADEADALAIGDALIAPLAGILTYEMPIETLVQSLHLICAGERVFPGGLVPGNRPPPPSSAPRFRGRGLSPREREVLSHLLAGHSNKVIARHLGTSEATVKIHLKNLLRKIRVGNRTQAAVWALSNLPELEPPPRACG